MPRRWLFYAVALTGAASLALGPLSVLSVLLHVIALAATTRLATGHRKNVVLVLSAGLVAALVSMTRFVLSDALSGIVEARGRDSSARAVSMLREILFAEDAMRRYAFIDPDRDGVGSAALLGELSGASGVRGGRPLATPPLDSRLAPAISTKAGPALESSGYFFLVCLPGLGGGWVTTPGDPVDENAAEVRFLAYAWPASSEAPHRTAYFIDEHENILESQSTNGTELRLVGPDRAPSCDEVRTRPAAWRPWRGKQPRQTLPGSKAKL